MTTGDPTCNVCGRYLANHKDREMCVGQVIGQVVYRGKGAPRPFAIEEDSEVVALRAQIADLEDALDKYHDHLCIDCKHTIDLITSFPEAAKETRLEGAKRQIADLELQHVGDKAIIEALNERVGELERSFGAVNAKWLNEEVCRRALEAKLTRRDAAFAALVEANAELVGAMSRLLEYARFGHHVEDKEKFEAAHDKGREALKLAEGVGGDSSTPQP